MNNWEGLFSRFRAEAFRLELLNFYNVPEERSEFARFLRGNSGPDCGLMRDWIAIIRSAKERTAEMRRVHILPPKLTPYLRFEIEWGYWCTSRAGEAIFLLDRKRYDQIREEFTAADCWLFDERYCFLMRYNSGGEFLGVRRIREAFLLKRYITLKNALLTVSIPLKDFRY